MGEGTMTYMESETFGPANNLFMTFHFDGNPAPVRFGYVITQKLFDTFIGSNQPTGTCLIEEDIDFPETFMHGSTRRGLVHYTPDGKKFAAYVPVFPTVAEMKAYDAAFGRTM